MEQVKETRETSEKQLSELKGEHGCMYMKIKQAEMVDFMALRKADSCACIDVMLCCDVCFLSSDRVLCRDGEAKYYCAREFERVTADL